MAERENEPGRDSGRVAAGRFRSAFAAAPSGEQAWADVAKALLEALGDFPEDSNLAFLYATDVLADDLGSILTFLREKTGIPHWCGTVGVGILANGVEVYDRPALSLLTMALTEHSFRPFDPVTGSLEAFRETHRTWIDKRHPILGVVHGDPRNRDMAEIIEDLSEASSAFLVGGLSSSRGAMPQIASRVGEGGLSGVLFSSDQLAVAGLTQGCTPIGPLRRITECEESVIKTIDDRPAVEILKEDIGELLARDLSRIGGYIYISFPIATSDTGDYLVRNLVAVDAAKGWIQVAETVSPGMALSFCRRDHQSAREDLRRMLRDIVERAGEVPRAGLYFSCIARGQSLFGEQSAELREIQAHLGDIPLAGFFANGEISNNRLYAYTGVLALLF